MCEGVGWGSVIFFEHVWISVSECYAFVQVCIRDCFVLPCLCAGGGIRNPVCVCVCVCVLACECV
jgi:hypothetical protein